MKHIALKISKLSFLLVFYLTNTYAQQPGTLDASFGNGGKAEYKIGWGALISYITTQSDGKLLSASNDGAYISRYNSDGSFDKSFSGNGTDTTTGNYQVSANSILVQTDGRILVAGHGYQPGSSSYDYYLARYLPNGGMGNSFNNSGRIYTNSTGWSNDYCHAATLQSDGKIILAGKTGIKVGVMRYLPDGRIDSSFNEDGIAQDAYSGNTTFTEAHGVHMLPDNRILVTGTVVHNGHDFFLMRYKQDGFIDSSFGLNGRTAFDFGGMKWLILPYCSRTVKF